MESVIFAIVQLCTLAVMLIYGKKLSIANSNKQYWKTAVIPLLTYGFAYGLRFGRLIDWNPYYFRYVHLGKNMNLSNINNDLKKALNNSKCLNCGIYKYCDNYSCYKVENNMRTCNSFCILS